VWFDADAPLHSFRGQTQDLSGTFTLQQTAPPQISEAKVMINAASLKTGNSDRDADMYRDFLEVERFPSIDLHIETVQAAPAATGETSWGVVLQAQLTVHGITRSVQVPAIVDLAAERVAARGQIHLDMRDFNIRVPRILLIPMKSEVLVGFDVVARPIK
jgi:polyisoprenoid-binding protein YceI